MFKLKHYLFLIVPCVSLGFTFAQAKSLQPMTDDQLAKTTGQALMSLSYVAPIDTLNKEALRTGGSQDIGFYKLGLEAELALNANINKLQLGCGGINGDGKCDIDIDNLSLSGLGNSNSSNTNNNTDRAARVGSSAVLTNPFIQFAIKNPNSASKREIVGINLSSEMASGLMTFGKENSTAKNGINSLSGYMQVAATTGTALVNGFGTSGIGEEARPTLNQSDGYNAISGKACCLIGNLTADFDTTDYFLNLRDKGTQSNILKGDLVLPTQVITGSRINSAQLKATAMVRPIDLTGKISATALAIIPLNNKSTSGEIQNLTVDVTIDEDLGYFHKAILKGTPVSLSLQSQNLQWTGNKSISKKGWWLEMSDSIDIGKIDPANKIDIPKETLNEVMKQVGAYLTANPVDCGSFLALDCLAGSAVPVGTVNLVEAQKAKMSLTNIQLKQQDFTPNCYGNLKFC